jgi:hypothetical protein
MLYQSYDLMLPIPKKIMAPILEIFIIFSDYWLISDGFIYLLEESKTFLNWTI